MNKKKAEAVKASDVAKWMVNELEQKEYLYQESAVDEIRRRFGARFAYWNENGNLAMSRTVLAEFGKLTERTVVWERDEKCWRKRTSSDPKGQRAIES
jgi:Family of unknown function (DUF6953)